MRPPSFAEVPAATRAGLKTEPGRSGQMSWDHARVAAHTAPLPLAPLRSRRLAAAAGLTLAEPIRALVARPAFGTAAMDGYAVAGGGTGPWSLIGQVRAGEMWERSLALGEVVEISTGAQVPDGATAVLPVEAAVRAQPGSG